MLRAKESDRETSMSTETSKTSGSPATDHSCQMRDKLDSIRQEKGRARLLESIDLPGNGIHPPRIRVTKGVSILRPWSTVHPFSSRNPALCQTLAVA